MLTKVKIRGFKSIEDVEFEPDIVNVLIGANGSGKSNLLEAIGVLSAAASGRVDDVALMRRGVRPGVPALYKCAFKGPKHMNDIHFGAWSSSVSYEVNLFNPIKEPHPAWRYHTEHLRDGTETIVERSTSDKEKYNPEAGLAALKSVELDPDLKIFQFFNSLRNYAIYSPDTNTLRGIIPDPQQRLPVGLSGGQLEKGVSELLVFGEKNSFLKQIAMDSLNLIDWAESYGTAPASSMHLSPSVGSTQRVIRFKDKFMKSGRDTLTGYDASEGSLYVLFHAVLAAHPSSPAICAVDNADHALNPRLARELFKNICKWFLDSHYSRQLFLTSQNPLTLDGLPLQDDRVRLFAVDRTEKGRTTIRQVVFTEKLRKMAEKGWSVSRLWTMGHLGGVPNV